MSNSHNLYRALEDTRRLLEQVHSFVCRFVAFTDPMQSIAVTLWIAHTHAFPAAETTIRLSIQSAEKQSGKTRLLEVLELLVSAPMQIVNASEAALFRSIAAGPTTVLIDEGDALFGPKARDHEDLRALLNAGYRKGATIARCVGDGAKLEVRLFEVFAPAAIAGIGSLPDTIEDRSLVLRMRRRAPNEMVERLRRRDVEPEAAELRRDLADVFGAESVIGELADARPALPDELADRAADCWEPLLGIADLAGGTWPSKARLAAVTLATGADETPSIGVTLLARCRAAFARGSHSRMPTADLLVILNDDETAPWSGWNDGDGLRASDLAKKLKPHRITPKKFRTGGETSRGYVLDDFADAFNRYLPCPQTEQAEHTEHAPSVGPNVPDVPDVPSLGEEVEDLGAWSRDGLDLVADEEPALDQLKGQLGAEVIEESPNAEEPL